MELVVAGEKAQLGLALLDGADAAEKVGKDLIRGIPHHGIVLCAAGHIVVVVNQQDQVAAFLQLQRVDHLPVECLPDLPVLQLGVPQGHEQAVFLTVRHLLGGKHQVDQVAAQRTGQGLFKSERYFSASSWGMEPRDSSR